MIKSENCVTCNYYIIDQLQCGLVVTVLAVRFGDPWCKIRSDHCIIEFNPGIPWFNFLAAFVNSQLPLPPTSCCCSVLSFH